MNNPKADVVKGNFIPITIDEGIVGVFAIIQVDNSNYHHYSEGLHDWLNALADSFHAKLSDKVELESNFKSTFAAEVEDKRANLILNSVSAGIFVLDNIGRTLFINREGADMLGYQPTELVGLKLMEYIHQIQGDGSRYSTPDCQISLTIADGIIRRKDDEIFWRKDGTSFLSIIGSRLLWMGDDLRSSYCF